MAITRGASKQYNVGEKPPTVLWTFVKGDTSAFRVYVTDDEREPLLIEDWEIAMDIYRPSTDEVILTLTPGPIEFQDSEGSFTVSLTADQSEILETGDVFDIQLTELDSGARVWTVAKGSMVVIEDITQ